MIKGLITKYNKKGGYFTLTTNGTSNYYYLTKRLKDIFAQSLAKDSMISFNINDEIKYINYNKIKLKAYQIEAIFSISYPNSTKLLYDVNELNNKMLNTLLQSKYFLIIDFENSMSNYHEKKYISEIIQVGYVLCDIDQNIISTKSIFLKTSDGDIHNKKIFKLIRASEEEYNNNAVSFDIFYDDLKNIMNEYNPKLVIWGINDYISIVDSYKINKKEPLTSRNNFINLLNLHKNYYGLKDDLGLYAAYSLYSYLEETQDHDALNDAIKTKEVFFYFIDRLKNK